MTLLADRSRPTGRGVSFWDKMVSAMAPRSSASCWRRSLAARFSSRRRPWSFSNIRIVSSPGSAASRGAFALLLASESDGSPVWMPAFLSTDSACASSRSISLVFLDMKLEDRYIEKDRSRNSLASSSVRVRRRFRAIP